MALRAEPSGRNKEAHLGVADAVARDPSWAGRVVGAMGDRVGWAATGHTSWVATTREDLRFSDELEEWLEGDPHKTFGEMSDVFGERGFAVGIVIAASVPALPLPTGGVSHAFEVIAVLVAVQMVLGRTKLWLPRRLRDRELGSALAKRALPFLVRRIRWLERHARPRGTALFENRWFLRLLGLVVIALTVAAALAPPFSGLDTLPALGAVLIALSILLQDVVVLIVGVLVGTGGVALIITLGAALARFLRDLL